MRPDQQSFRYQHSVDIRILLASIVLEWNGEFVILEAAA